MNKRIVVCNKCGALYDLHYIDKIQFRKKEPVKFECINCGMVEVIYKNFTFEDQLKDDFDIDKVDVKKLKEISK